MNGFQLIFPHLAVQEKKITYFLTELHIQLGMCMEQIPF